MKLFVSTTILITLLASSNVNAYSSHSQTRLISCDQVMVTAQSVIKQLRALKTSSLELRKAMNRFLIAAHTTKVQTNKRILTAQQANTTCREQLSSLAEQAEASSHPSVTATVTTAKNLDARGFEFGLLLDRAVIYAKALLR